MVGGGGLSFHECLPRSVFWGWKGNRTWKARGSKVDLALFDHFAVETRDYIHESQEKKMLKKGKHSWLRWVWLYKYMNINENDCYSWTSTHGHFFVFLGSRRREHTFTLNNLSTTGSESMTDERCLQNPIFIVKVHQTWSVPSVVGLCCLVSVLLIFWLC